MILTALLTALFGLIVGSFLNVVVLRHGARKITGRSSCMSCGHVLNWYELVPIFSWILLRGKCLKCHTPISVQYILVELTTGILFGILGYVIPLPLLGDTNALVHSLVILGLSFVIMADLVAIAVYDMRHTIIPDWWSVLFALSAIILTLYSATIHETSIFWYAAAGPLVALPLFCLSYFSGGRWMGMGDPKLALGMGWLLGIQGGLAALWLAFVLGAIISVFVLMPLPYILHAIKKGSLKDSDKYLTLKSEVPFGPFLILGTIIIWFSQFMGFDFISLFS